MANGVRTTSVKANVIRTQGITANGIRTTSTRAYAVQTQSVKAYVYETQTLSVKVFAFVVLPYLPITHVSSHAAPDSKRPHIYVLDEDGHCISLPLGECQSVAPSER
jgi:hypothetical protein